MKILITGIEGYIGPVMSRVLQAEGHEVSGLDTGYFAECWLGGVARNGGSNTQPLDIRDVLVEHLTGFDAIAHLAAISNDPMGELNENWTHDINHRGSVGLALAAREAGVRRFLYSSSCSVYGVAGGDRATETSPLAPVSAYAVSKVRAEEAIEKLGDANFSPVFLRNSTAYGVSPRLRLDLVLNNLAAWAHTTRTINITSDGTPWRPIIHIEDISRAFAAALTAPREAIHGQAFNVGRDAENYQVRQLAEIVNEVMPECAVRCLGQTGGDPRSYRVDFSKITNLLPAFRPQWNARTGVQELLGAYVQANLTLEAFQGRNYLRLKQLRYLLDQQRLDGDLRWKIQSKFAEA